MKTNIYITSLVAFASITLLSCGGGKKDDAKAAAANAAQPVKTVAIQQSAAVYFDEYPATIVAQKEVILTPQASGTITGIYFKDGQVVQQGQKLYSIDVPVSNANYDNAVANYEVQRANLVKAEKDAARYHQLDKQDAIAKQQVDYADAALTAARRQVQAAQASINSSKANVNFGLVVAPFTGTIGISKVRVGAAVVAGQTQLNTVSTDNPMAADINISQSDVFKFEKMKTKALSEQLFTLVFGTDPYPESGKIDIIDRAVDPATGTVKARIIFNNKDKMLRSGMTAVIKVKNDHPEPKFIIPNKALVEQLGEFYVYVVTDSSTATQKHVVPGRQLGDRIIINEGLSPGMKIVVEGQQKLKEGAKVKL
ncbi:efflux RND transporter periplasmic adaptor subunit [Taibaiella sp. KBW10]|uniref:efflux RND transporter periplasmic adaptor subunit n=1 Tax=Taibaiella sp. KBW10 TaxID=2153357 RepID=UPI0018F2EF4B|nr:efflux RND transporter periplasmic adaptor subunit [Taibaiella sp. KBW10]